MTPRQGRMNAGKRDRLDRYPECVYMIRYSIMTLRRRKTVAIVADLAPRQGEKV